MSWRPQAGAGTDGSSAKNYLLPRAGGRLQCVPAQAELHGFRLRPPFGKAAGHMDRIGVTSVPPGNIDDLAASGQRPVAGRDLPVFPAAGSQSVDVGLAPPRVWIGKAARLSSFSAADS